MYNLIYHKMWEYGGERRVKVWVLDHIDKKTPACFLVDGYEPENNTVYQFHGFHTYIKNLTITKNMRFSDTW